MQFFTSILGRNRSCHQHQRRRLLLLAGLFLSSIATAAAAAAAAARGGSTSASVSSCDALPNVPVHNGPCPKVEDLSDDELVCSFRVDCCEESDEVEEGVCVCTLEGLWHCIPETPCDCTDEPMVGGDEPMVGGDEPMKGGDEPIFGEFEDLEVGGGISIGPEPLIASCDVVTWVPIDGERCNSGRRDRDDDGRRLPLTCVFPLSCCEGRFEIPDAIRCTCGHVDQSENENGDGNRGQVWTCDPPDITCEESSMADEHCETDEDEDLDRDARSCDSVDLIVADGEDCLGLTEREICIAGDDCCAPWDATCVTSQECSCIRDGSDRYNFDCVDTFPSASWPEWEGLLRSVVEPMALDVVDRHSDCISSYVITSNPSQSETAGGGGSSGGGGDIDGRYKLVVVRNWFFGTVDEAFLAGGSCDPTPYLGEFAGSDLSVWLRFRIAVMVDGDPLCQRVDFIRVHRGDVPGWPLDPRRLLVILDEDDKVEDVLNG